MYVSLGKKKISKRGINSKKWAKIRLIDKHNTLIDEITVIYLYKNMEKTADAKYVTW